MFAAARRTALPCLAGTLASGAVLALGVPGHTLHRPDLDTYPQHYALAQDSRGIVYVGSLSGVLEFDGARWEAIPLPNRDMVRSLAVDDADRLWVGGYNLFGRIERDAAGRPRFVDESAQFAGILDGREFADVWDTVVLADGVYFRALRDVFHIDPVTGRKAHWHWPDRFGTIASLEGRTVLQFRELGFHVRDGDEWRPIPGSEGLRRLIYGLEPLPDGGLLTLGVDGAWWRLGLGGVEPVTMPPQLPPSSEFEHTTTLADGSLVLAGNDGRLHLVSADRSEVRVTRIGSSYLAGVLPDRAGGLLALNDDGLIHVHWPSPWTRLGPDEGVRGSVIGLTSDGNLPVLLTTAGAFTLSGAGADPALSPLDGIPGATYDLLRNGDALLLAGTHRLLRLTGNGAEPLFDEIVYPRAFVRSRHDPGRILVATEAGLRLLHRAGSSWRLSRASNEGQDRRVDGMVEISTSEVWFGTHRHGLFRARIDGHGEVSEEPLDAPTRKLRLGPVAGAHLTEWDGQLIATTHEGIYRLHEGSFVPDTLGGLSALRKPGEWLRLARGVDGTQYAMGIRSLYRRRPGSDWEVPLGYTGLAAGAFLGHLRHAGMDLFASTGGLLVFDPGRDGPSSAVAPRVQLRSVTHLSADGVETPLDLSGGLELPAGNWSVRFRYVLPGPDHAAQYRARLIGYEASYSAWSGIRGYTYARLRPGDYRLEVEARDAEGRVSSIAPYLLTVSPPWYQHPAATVGQALLALLAALAATRLLIARRTRLLERDKAQLQSRVAEATRELAQANARLEAMAHVDGLTGIANRRRLDLALAAAWEACQHGRHPIALLAIDVDRFKTYNDDHGHLEGDTLLCSIASRLAQGMPAVDGALLGRFGGEEFVAVLPSHDGESALRVAERLRAAIADACLGCTVSIGVASVPPPAGSIEHLLRRADAALYQAKRAGRNRVAAAA